MRASVAAVAAACLLLAGCGSDDPPRTPSACLAPASAYLRALESAPGEVLLAGETQIEGCLVEQQEPGALASVGESMVGAAVELNREVRREPDPRTITQLGYLVGTVRVAASMTGGIHEDLALRVETAARHRPGGGTFPASFEHAFARGYGAAEEAG